MRILTDVGISWRNYLFANHDGKYNDIPNIEARMRLIDDAKDEILEEMLKPEPSMAIVNACKKEIDFQKENLKDMVQEFYEYAKNPDLFVEDILDEMGSKGTACEFYRILSEYRELSKKADEIFDKYKNMIMDIDFADLSEMRDCMSLIVLDAIVDNHMRQLQLQFDTLNLNSEISPMGYGKRKLSR